MKRWYKCTACRGTGHVAFFSYDRHCARKGVVVRHCEKCGGKGKVLREVSDDADGARKGR